MEEDQLPLPQHVQALQDDDAVSLAYSPSIGPDCDINDPSGADSIMLPSAFPEPPPFDGNRIEPADSESVVADGGKGDWPPDDMPLEQLLPGAQAKDDDNSLSNEAASDPESEDEGGGGAGAAESSEPPAAPRLDAAAAAPPRPAAADEPANPRIHELIWNDVVCRHCNSVAGQFKYAQNPKRGSRSDPPTWVMRVQTRSGVWPCQGPCFHRRQTHIVGESQDYVMRWIDQHKICCDRRGG